jgi:hypothetical protein
VKLIALKFLVVAILVLLVSTALDVPPTKAGAQTVYGYTCFSYIPAEWSEFKGGNQQSGLAFQDHAGTLRFVTNLPCDSTPQPALEIRRTTPKTN